MSDVVSRLLRRVNRTEYWYGDDDEALDREAVRVIQELEDENGRLHAENMALRTKLNAAIKHCAQEADKYGCWVAAARIRALKDEP